MKAMKVATQKTATTKKKAMPLKAMKAAMKAMQDETATAKIAMTAMKAAKAAAMNRRLRDALIAAEKDYQARRGIITKSIKEEEIAQRRVAAAARTKRRARAASGPASGPSQRARDVNTTMPPPDDAVWWFADTRGCKSVWAVAWNYKGKIQQVMYKED